MTFNDKDLSVAQAFVGDNRQLLFRNGDTILVNEPLAIKWAKNLSIAAFGECWERNEKGICKNPPVFMNKKAKQVIHISSPDGTQQASNIIIKDLKFINQNTDSSTTAIFVKIIAIETYYIV
ncbi:MAG: hypothetical protein HC803_02820 [Saprospiraceae bacterium]|nr:hypothetical protein [Saprospiraceae bacterium]